MADNGAAGANPDQRRAEMELEAAANHFARVAFDQPPEELVIVIAVECLTPAGLRSLRRYTVRFDREDSASSP